MGDDLRETLARWVMESYGRGNSTFQQHVEQVRKDKKINQLYAQVIRCKWKIFINLFLIKKFFSERNSKIRLEEWKFQTNILLTIQPIKKLSIFNHKNVMKSQWSENQRLKCNLWIGKLCHVITVLFSLDYSITKGRTDQLQAVKQSPSGPKKLNNLENHDDMHKAFGFKSQNTTTHASTELIPVTDIS